MRTVTSEEAYKYGRAAFGLGLHDVNLFVNIFAGSNECDNLIEWRRGFTDAKNEVERKPTDKISTRTQLKAELKSVLNRCISGSLSLNDIVTTIGEHLSDDIAVEMWTQEEHHDDAVRRAMGTD